MNPVYLITALIIGTPLGVGIALYIMSSALNKSNNFGDSTAELESMAESGLKGTKEKDNVSPTSSLDPIQNPIIREKKGLL